MSEPSARGPMEAAASAPARLMPGQRAAFLPPRAAESYRRLFGDLRSEFVHLSSRGRWSDAESREWAALSEAHRMVLLLLGDIDGDLAALARRAWLEIPDPERQEIKAQARYLRQAFGRIYSLATEF